VFHSLTAAAFTAARQNLLCLAGDKPFSAFPAAAAAPDSSSIFAAKYVVKNFFLTFFLHYLSKTTLVSTIPVQNIVSDRQKLPVSL